MNALLADIRRKFLECARDAETLCHRAGAHSLLPERIRTQVQRLVELERALDELTRAGPPTPRDTPTDGDAA